MRVCMPLCYQYTKLNVRSATTLHTSRLWHEQSRTDRDSHISINFDEIFPGTQSNFEKRTLTTSDNLGQPYDLGNALQINPIG